VNDDLSISNLCESKVGDNYLYFAVGLMLSPEPGPKTTGFSLVKGMLFEWFVFISKCLSRLLL